MYHFYNYICLYWLEIESAVSGKSVLALYPYDPIINSITNSNDIYNPIGIIAKCLYKFS